MKQIQDTIIGLGGIGLVETVPALIPAQPLDYSAIVQTAIQLLIGIATLLGLFRKAKPVTT